LDYNTSMSAILATYNLTARARLELAQGDLTQEAVDAIVNAANENLAHGAGIAAAIVQKGGQVIQSESSAWVKAHGPVSHAEPAVTGAGKLPAKKVIHAVGPMWGSGDEDRKLEQAIEGSLRAAEALGLESIAFPAISTGIFGFPKDRAARVIIAAIRAHFAAREQSSLRLARLTLWGDDVAQIFLREARKMFGEHA
jgi:O-acetyl-ADP-ribose deacetylase (regulator of RNase III)